MFDERKVRLDLLAIALLAFTIFLTLALFSYSPADRFEPLELGGRTLYAQDLARLLKRIHIRGLTRSRQ